MGRCNCKLGFVVLEFVEGCSVHKEEDSLDGMTAKLAIEALKEMLKQKDQIIERFVRGDLPGEY